MTTFPNDGVANGLERALAQATHLTDRHAAAVAAARRLAVRIDEKHPNDFVSHSTFLKFLEALQLVPPREQPKPGPAATASHAQQMVNEMRDQVRRGGLSIVPETAE